LIVDELNNNAIEYGSKKGDLNKMTFSFQRNTKTLLSIEVEDSGAGKDAKNAETMRKLQSTKIKEGFENHASIRGRGLFMIIVNLVDELYFKDSDADQYISTQGDQSFYSLYQKLPIFSPEG